MAKKNIQTKEMKEEKRKKLKRRVTQKGELESEAEPKKKKRSLQVGRTGFHCSIQCSVDRLLPVVFIAVWVPHVIQLQLSLV